MTINNFITRAMIAVFCVLVATTATSAQTSITPSTPSQDGDGNYLIGTAAELYGFAQLVNNGNATANAKLTADIVVNENVLAANGDANTGDFEQWTPIGNDRYNDKVYSGTFDGQGHTISGLYVSGSGWNVGLIGTAGGSAVVKNLGVVDSYFGSSNNHIGSIVGGLSDGLSVTLANVYSTSTVAGDNYVGGLVGGDGTGSMTIINSYFAGKTSAGYGYGIHHDDLVSGDFNMHISGTLNVVNSFVLGTSLYGTPATAEQMSDGTVAAALHYYQDALADGSMFGLSDGKTNFSGTIDGESVTTANITLHTFDGDTKTYSQKYIIGNITPLPVNVEREGYKFAGWYDNADLEGDAVTSISSSETDDKEYWAKLERSHSVTFVLNGGNIDKGEIDHYIEGETTALPTFVLKDGASFEGWYTTEDFTGNRYYFIPATATEDMAFYAKWGEAKTTFYLVQGGSPEPVNVLYEGENIVWLDETTMHGYYINDGHGNKWGGSGSSIKVPYTGGESTFGNGGRIFRGAQSGFYVFTLTDKGDGNWFISVLYPPLEYYCTVSDTPIPDQTYTGSAIEPSIDIENTLTLGTDYTIEYSDNTNAGTATVTIAGMGNYVGIIEKKFEIAKAPLTITAKNWTITYGDDPENDGVEYSGFVNGETESVLGGELSYAYDYAKLDNVGTYTITPSGLTADNYDITFASGTLTVEPKKTNFAAVQILENQNGKRAVIDGTYSGSEPVDIPSPVTVDDVVINRSFTPLKPATLVLPCELPEGTTANADFYQLADVSQKGCSWWADFDYIGEGVVPKANTPYAVVLHDSVSSGVLRFNLDGKKATCQTNKVDTTYVSDKTWYFVGVYSYKEWKEGNEELGLAYAFAGSDNEGGAAKGEFGKIKLKEGHTPHANPLRSYLRKKDSDVQLEASLCRAASVPGLSLAPAYSVQFIPEPDDVIEVEFVKSALVNGGANGGTTIIKGRYNTRTGEFKVLQTYDLKGRKLNGKPTAKGVYYGKKVPKK